jgi:hypothetical protein
MNPISSRNMQTSNVAPPNPSSSNAQKPAKVSNQATDKDALKLPEDIVTLSTSQNPTTKKPSVPVTNVEKDALLQDSLRKSISIHV